MTTEKHNVVIIDYRRSHKTTLWVKERFFLIFVLGLTTHIDDEYKWAGVEDPKIMVTTSRDPSSKLKQFAKVTLKLIRNILFLKTNKQASK